MSQPRFLVIMVDNDVSEIIDEDGNAVNFVELDQRGFEYEPDDYSEIMLKNAATWPAAWRNQPIILEAIEHRVEQGLELPPWAQSQRNRTLLQTLNELESM